MVQVESLLEPISSDDPCGPDLEYDKAFTDLDRAGQGKPEQQVGSTLIPAEPPDWKQIEKQATALFGRTRDLRVALWLTKSLIHTGGFAGFAQGLAVMQGLLERYWDGVHPRLDPDDDNDPSMRVNILSELCDGATTLLWVRSATLVNARGLGRFTLRDVAVAQGEAQPEAGGSATEMSTISAAFRATAPADNEAMLEALRAARKSVYDIENFVTDQVGSSNAPELSKLRNLLGQAVKVVEQNVSAAEAPAPEVSAAGGEGDGGGWVEAPQGASGGAGTSQAATARFSGDINTREDVLRALDKIIEYYERKEPASPIPLFIYRCRRMANMGFLELMRELTPDSVSQVETLVGRTKEQET